ncbi:EAL domain-containing protein [Solibacillus sp. FSL H8-0538]|uniref:EAL domain-containing protein n=1 Tax=Solibacillus sp. FSL H8-0538 TaxID=2921400 RepID=UPI0030F8FC1A
MKPISVTTPKTVRIFENSKLFNPYKSRLFLYMKRLFALKKIMRKEQMNTFFQPILDIEKNETFGFEALNRPTPSPLFSNADVFYEFVGQTKKVFSFECFCRNLSLHRFRERLDDHLRNQNFILFVNIHPNVLLDKNYHSGETLSLLRSLGIQPQQVVFELTERSAVTDFDEFSRVLSHYRSQGYRIAIDDVGSGYNSLKTLIYLKPEFIKIDRSLIQNIDMEIAQQQLLSVILHYAQQSGTKVIAEGIERIEEFHFIKQAGVHYAQGYALGRPNEQLLLAHSPMIS